ncbi:MAG: TPM domain-containing protein, partial [Saprospiraceae bacterium]|nr:TPM domain-containing protein [Saprospiraceae bacterium]
MMKINFLLQLCFLFGLGMNCSLAQADQYQGVNSLHQARYKGLVQDYANLLSSREYNFLEQKLANYKDSTSTAIQVVTIPNLEGQNIKELSLAIANSWGFTDPSQKNGILLLVAKEDRRIRMELAKGILTHISSADANQILLDHFKENAQKERYYEGLDEVISVIIAMLEGQFTIHYPTENTLVLITCISTLLVFFCFSLWTDEEERMLVAVLMIVWIGGLAAIIDGVGNHIQWIYVFGLSLILVLGIIAYFYTKDGLDNRQQCRKYKRNIEKNRSILLKTYKK